MVWLWATLVLMMKLWQTQPNATLNAPVTALAIHGDRLFIGQNDQLVEAAITSNGLTITRSLAVTLGAIRAIAVLDNGSTLVLSEDGLTALDQSDTITDFAPGGGYHLSAHGNRVYVAALAAGVRIYTLNAGKFTLAGQLLTTRPVEDVAAEGTNGLWTAEGDDGLRLYDMTSPAKPTVLFISNTYRPAHLVRAGNLHLVVSYADQLAVFDTLDLKAPRLIGTIPLGGSAGAFASDVLLDQTDLLVGRSDIGGPDVLRYSAEPPFSASPSATYGSDGAGNTIARHGDDLFIGSALSGLHRVQLNASGMVERNSWNANAFTACTTADYKPVNPAPRNLSLLPHTNQVTLSWSATCLAGRYSVKINGKLMGIVDQTVFEYALPTAQAVFTWQIDALTDTGIISGARWTFERTWDGYIAAPSRPRLEQILYVPSPIWLDFSALQTPLGTLALTCAALIGGLLVVIGGAWVIGTRSGRRREQI